MLQDRVQTVLPRRVADAITPLSTARYWKHPLAQNSHRYIDESTTTPLVTGEIRTGHLTLPCRERSAPDPARARPARPRSNAGGMNRARRPPEETMRSRPRFAKGAAGREHDAALRAWPSTHFAHIAQLCGNGGEQPPLPLAHLSFLSLSLSLTSS